MAENESLEWKAMDQTSGPHTADWYWAVTIIALSIAITSYILDNVLFSILIVLSTIVLFLRTLQKPRENTYTLTSKGLWINKEFNSFKSLESFWVDEEYGTPTLILKPRGLTSPLLIIPFSGIEAEELRTFLSTVLDEVENHEPFSKKVMEFLGF